MVLGCAECCHGRCFPGLLLPNNHEAVLICCRRKQSSPLSNESRKGLTSSWLRVQLLFQERVSKFAATASHSGSYVSRNPSSNAFRAAPRSYQLMTTPFERIEQHCDALPPHCYWSGTD